jgi:short-subunit dehydrogenase
MDIENKLILITGASSGIGAASAVAVAKQGADVILLARNEAKLREVAAKVADFGRKAYVYPVDLSLHEEIAVVCDRIATEVGVPDVIVNNAGMGRWLYVEETDSAELQQMIAVPYLAAFNVTKAFMPAMLARDSGWIVNLTSPVAFHTYPGATGYAASRWAIRGFSEALYLDLYRTNIGVTLLVPGEVSSPYFDNNPGARERLPYFAKLGKVLTSDQAANLLLYALKHEKRQYIRPRIWVLTAWLARAFPSMTRQFAIRTGHNRKRN